MPNAKSKLHEDNNALIFHLDIFIFNSVKKPTLVGS